MSLEQDKNFDFTITHFDEHPCNSGANKKSIEQLMISDKHMKIKKQLRIHASVHELAEGEMTNEYLVTDIGGKNKSKQIFFDDAAKKARQNNKNKGMKKTKIKKVD